MDLGLTPRHDAFRDGPPRLVQAHGHRLAAAGRTAMHGGMGITDLPGLHDGFRRLGLNRQLLDGPGRARHLAAAMQGLAIA